MGDLTPNVDISSVVAALGALGMASFALVDATKVGRKGGISNSGFLFIEQAVQLLLPNEKRSDKMMEPGAPRPLLDILHANWIAGVVLPDQMAIAKSLIKLRLTLDTAPQFAAAASISVDVLKSVAEKMNDGRDLEPTEINALGRFDLALAAILDEGYQRADQKYRNSTRVIASIVAVVLAIMGGWAINTGASENYFGSQEMWINFFCGLLATPLAPIFKDLASALQAGVKLAQAVIRR